MCKEYEMKKRNCKNEKRISRKEFNNNNNNNNK